MSTILWPNSGAISWREPLLKGLDRAEYLKILSEKLVGRVQEAWLFGSLADPDSSQHAQDADLIMVTDSAESFHRRALAFSDIADLTTHADILVYTPNEWVTLKEEKGGFWGDVNRTRIRIL